MLALLVEGYRTSEISEHLHITRKTTATHIEGILAKLGAHSQAQTVAFALRDGLLDNQRPAKSGKTVAPRWPASAGLLAPDPNQRRGLHARWNCRCPRGSVWGTVNGGVDGEVF